MSSNKTNLENIFVDENNKVETQPSKVIFDSAVFAVDFAKATRKFWYIILFKTF